MIESLLIADVGVVAARVAEGCRRLGIKSVGVRLSHPDPKALDGRGQPIGAADRLADDVVLLAGLRELHDGNRVLGAALAAAVDGIHPGRGPLRTLQPWSERVRAAHVVPVVSSGVRMDRPERYPDGTVEVVFVAAEAGCVELGTVERAAGLLRSPAVGDCERARQLARAAVAELDLRGLVSIAVADGAVIGVDGGLTSGQAALELSAGIDLLAIQLAHAGAEPLPTPPTARRVAVTRGRLDVVPDAAVLDAVDPTAVRLDVTPLHARGHESIVWATAVGADENEARTALDTYVALLPT